MSVLDASILSRTFDWLKAHLARNGELDGLSAADIDFLAADIGITAKQLRAIAPSVVDHGWQMDAMMRARGLDPSTVRQMFAPLVRDMEVLCTQCRSAGRCRNALARGTAAQEMDAFCLNAGTIEQLAAGPDAPPR